MDSVDKQKVVCPKVDHTLLMENINCGKSSDEIDISHSCTSCKY